MALTNHHINYVEFKAQNLAIIKAFYQTVFQWEFTDYGPTYTAFSNSGLEGGFEVCEEPLVNGALIVLYHDDLEALIPQVESAGGQILKAIFSFPGGRRFHFADPAGNELAVWSDQGLPEE